MRDEAFAHDPACEQRIVREHNQRITESTFAEGLQRLDAINQRLLRREQEKELERMRELHYEIYDGTR